MAYKYTRKLAAPFCTNCDTGDHIHSRIGGGWRCNLCGRIWDENRDIVGELPIPHDISEQLKDNTEHVGITFPRFVP